MSLRLKFLAAFASALAGLFVAAMAYAALVSLHDAQSWVAHTYEVIDTLRAQESSVIEAESAQRGLLLSPALQNPYDRATYDRARAAALNGSTALEELTTDNPRQQERLVRLRAAANRRLDILERILRGDRAGIGANDGRIAMVEMRSIAADVEAEERTLLADRIHRADVRTGVTKAILIVGSLLAFFLSLATTRDLKRDVDNRERQRLLIEDQAKQLAVQTVHLEASKNAAETANRTKSMFLANMSHELRTPLNAVLGYSEMLQEEAEDQGVPSFIPDLKSIHAAGKHLLGLINDVLDLSKIEAGKMDLYLEDFTVGDMLGDVERTIRPLVAEKGNQLVIERAFGDAPLTMHADLTKVRQTLFNVLSNAAKFSEKGTITVTVTTDDRARVIFRVSDTGIGMTDEQKGRLFEPFVQADASTTRKFGGTGLGLAISRRFCHMMGGDIVAESEIGKGSTFVITLPLTVKKPVERSESASHASTSGRATTASAADASAASLASRPLVLVIDDDADTRDLMERHLSKEGFRVETAANGADGLRLARELRPIAITLDVMMPTTDGWSVLTELKADPALQGIPVIMLTMVSDRGLGYRLGASEFMTKPIDRERLSEVLARYRPTATGDAGHVLVVEDDGETRHMMRQMLERDGWKVDDAENGVVALERVARAKPAVILLDLMMPNMDGFELAESLHASREYREIPIIVVTAKDITDDERKRLTGSVEKIIQKGAYDRQRLLAEVRDIVASHARIASPSSSNRIT